MDDLEQNRDFMDAGIDLGALADIHPAEQTAVLERLGPAHFRSKGFSFMGFLQTVYDEVSQTAGKVAGAVAVEPVVIDGRLDDLAGENFDRDADQAIFAEGAAIPEGEIESEPAVDDDINAFDDIEYEKSESIAPGDVAPVPESVTEEQSGHLTEAPPESEEQQS
jgi:hypothetical protein